MDRLLTIRTYGLFGGRFKAMIRRLFLAFVVVFVQGSLSNDDDGAEDDA